MNKLKKTPLVVFTTIVQLLRGVPVWEDNFSGEAAITISNIIILSNTIHSP